MSASLPAATPAGPLFRVGRRPDAWIWSDWSFAGEDGTFGNRYDDPEGEYRVLYAAGQRRGAFAETLARFRPDPALVAEYAHIDSSDEDAEYPTVRPGVVPHGWLGRRCIGTAFQSGAFADVGHSSFIAYLRTAMGSRLIYFRLDDLDAGDLRRRAPRAFTQEISRHVFVNGRGPDGEPVVGIRYLSRLGDDLENWALFEGNELDSATSEDIAADDPDLVEVLALYGLVLTPER